MKSAKVIACITLASLIFSCTTEEEKNMALLSGNAVDQRLNNVRLINMIDNPILAQKETYFASTDASGDFTFDYRPDVLTSGALITGDFFHYICLLPGDNLQVSVDGDSLQFQGIGAERNRYLLDLEVKGLWNDGFIATSVRNAPPIERFIKDLDVNLAERARIRGQYELSDTFKRYSEQEDAVFYHTSLRDYATLLARGNQDSLLRTTIPQAVRDAFDPEKFTADEKVISKRYLQDVITFIRGRLGAKDTIAGFDLDKEMWAYAKDSLFGDTRDYVLAKFLVNKLHADQKVPQRFQEQFKEVATNDYAMSTVSEALIAHEKRQATLGKNSQAIFDQIMLATADGKQRSFFEMIAQYEGSAVYLEVWLVDWYPDYPYRPKFPLKKMKMRLEQEPIKIVQVALTDKIEGVWEQIESLSEVKEDQYYIKNPEDARFLNYYGINSYPVHFIFDKKGNLRSYRAPAPPANHYKMELSDIEKVLLELSKE